MFEICDVHTNHHSVEAKLQISGSDIKATNVHVHKKESGVKRRHGIKRLCFQRDTLKDEHTGVMQSRAGENLGYEPVIKNPVSYLP